MTINTLLISFHSVLFCQQNAVPEFLKSISFSQNYNENQFEINGFLAITAGYLIIQKNRSIKLRKRYKKLIKTLSEEELNQPIEKFDSQEFSEKITSSMEKRIVDGLVNFKKSEKFLEKETTLDTVLNDIDVEYQYLNDTVKKHTAMDAELYFHSLRINYIVKKLYKDFKFKDYKSFDLASLCGYYSTGEFEFYFRKICKVSLDYFIRQLKAENLKHKKSA